MSILFRDASIVDGTGGPAFRGDILVKGREIAAVGKAEPPPDAELVDAAGLTLAPGFIDVHNHAHDEVEGGIVRLNRAENIILQGVTTVVCGNCGGSCWPIGEHLDEVERRGVSVNYATLAGYGTVLREAKRTGQRVEDVARRAAEEGAVGLSTGVSTAAAEELSEAARVFARLGGTWATHINSEGRGVFDALRFTARVAELSGVRPEVSHLKARGRPMWGKAGDILALVEELNTKVGLGYDSYPYDGWYAGLWGMFEPETRMDASFHGALAKREAAALEKVKSVLEETGAGRITLALFPDHPELEGLTLAQLAEKRGEREEDAAAFVLSSRCSVVSRSMDQADVDEFICHPLGAVASDGHVREYRAGVCHPRNYGTFPRVLARHVRELGRVRVEEAVRKMTGLPASRFALGKRGLLRPGYAADVVVFDPRSVQDTATYARPHSFPEGLVHVLVGGEFAVRAAKQTEALPGMVIRLRA